MKGDLYSELFGLIASLDETSNETSIGGTTFWAQEPITLKGDTSLAFLSKAASKQTFKDGKNEVTSALFSLMGPMGALPYVYSEQVSRADRANDTAMRDFFDLFNHRSASLMYRAWRKNRVWLEQHPGGERSQQRKFSGLLEGIIGVSDLPKRIAWLEFDRDSALSSADLLSRRVRNARGLKQLLRRQFRMNIHIDEFVGAWEELPEEAQSTFSSGDGLRLGHNTIIGRQTWQVQSTFGVVINKPNSQQYKTLQPGSDALRRMQLVVRLYCTPELAFKIKIIVRGDVIEPGTLGTGEAGGAMLGWNTVLGQPDPDREYSFSICKDYNASRM